MVSYLWRRMRRKPWAALAVLLFAAILSCVLCGLQHYNETEQLHYEETWRTIPVKVSVTSLSGTKSDDLAVPGWVADLLIGKGGLADYLKDVQMKCSYPVTNYQEVGISRAVGITSTNIVKSFWPENGGEITWHSGYGENIFAENELLCLAPEGLTTDWDAEMPGQQLYLFFQNEYRNDHNEQLTAEYELYLTVAGTYRGGPDDLVYCSYGLVEDIFFKMKEERTVDSISATLTDNGLLDELKADRGSWFAAPNATGAKTEWGHFGYEYYLYALDINDELLRNVSSTLENSMLINRFCTQMIFLLSAGAGFFIGFLMIRQRKREITLMRTVGTRDRAIFVGFMLEQMLCAAVGTALGGVAFVWRPPERLLIFLGVYFVSLSVSLILFLRRNLLTTIKEDE